MYPIADPYYASISSDLALMLIMTNEQIGEEKLSGDVYLFLFGAWYIELYMINFM